MTSVWTTKKRFLIDGQNQLRQNLVRLLRDQLQHIGLLFWRNGLIEIAQIEVAAQIPFPRQKGKRSSLSQDFRQV